MTLTSSSETQYKRPALDQKIEPLCNRIHSRVRDSFGRMRSRRGPTLLPFTTLTPTLALTRRLALGVQPRLRARVKVFGTPPLLQLVVLPWLK